jgi:hypothetical protein
MGVVLDSDDRRTSLALFLAAEARSWGRVVNRTTGVVGWAIPSQRWLDVFHLATADSCTCIDFKRFGPNQLCKHARAVRLVELSNVARGRVPRRKRRFHAQDSAERTTTSCSTTGSPARTWSTVSTPITASRTPGR